MGTSHFGVKTMGSNISIIRKCIKAFSVTWWLWSKHVGIHVDLKAGSITKFRIYCVWNRWTITKSVDLCQNSVTVKVVEYQLWLLTIIIVFSITVRQTWEWACPFIPIRNEFTTQLPLVYSPIMWKSFSSLELSIPSTFSQYFLRTLVTICCWKWICHWQWAK